MANVISNRFLVLGSGGAQTASEKNNIDIINKNFSMISKINIPNMQVIYKEPSVDDTSGPTTTSTTFVNLSPLTINFTTPGGLLVIDASVDLTNSGLNGTYIILAINGATLANTQRQVDEFSANSSGMLQTMWAGQIGAGTYSVSVQWRVSAGTGTAQTRNRSLRVMVWEP